MGDAGGGSGGGGGALPTGCYKCGRPGHWSRDCPSSNPSSDNPNPNSTSSNYPKSSNNFSKNFGNGGGGSGGGGSFPLKAAAKPKKAPRTRPKLTPELLISDEKGLGYILRYFPRNFKYRGRGHEVNDLRNLLRMYAEWHEQFLPYFPFDQFIHKVEEVGSSKRVKNCIGELKDRVANGGDPTKLKDSATETDLPYDNEDVSNVEQPTHDQDLPFPENDTDDIHEDMLNELYNTSVEEPSMPRQSNTIGADVPSSDKSTEQSDKSVGAGGGSSNPTQITEEQKSLMEEKRKKALERAAARSRLLPAS